MSDYTQPWTEEDILQIEISNLKDENACLRESNAELLACIRWDEILEVFHIRDPERLRKAIANAEKVT